jgi:hypothetical protein
MQYSEDVKRTDSYGGFIGVSDPRSEVRYKRRLHIVILKPKYGVEVVAITRRHQVIFWVGVVG